MKSSYITADSRRRRSARHSPGLVLGTLLLSSAIFAATAAGRPLNNRAALAALSIACLLGALDVWQAVRKRPPDTLPDGSAGRNAESKYPTTLGYRIVERNEQRPRASDPTHSSAPQSTRNINPSKQPRLTAISETFRTRRNANAPIVRSAPKLQAAQNKSHAHTVERFTYAEYRALKGDARLLADKADFECLLDRNLTWHEYNDAKIRKLRWELKMGRKMLWEEYAQHVLPGESELPIKSK
jgi:hypothetical protein